MSSLSFSNRWYQQVIVIIIDIILKSMISSWSSLFSLSNWWYRYVINDSSCSTQVRLFWGGSQDKLLRGRLFHGKGERKLSSSWENKYQQLTFKTTWWLKMRFLRIKLSWEITKLKMIRTFLKTKPFIQIIFTNLQFLLSHDFFF